MRLNDYSDRLERLEYLLSEEEREKRGLQAKITHPELDPDNTELKEHVDDFLSRKMVMRGRDIDSNLMAMKSGRRQNTIIVSFSTNLFKRLLYAARNKIRKKHTL